MKRPMGNGLMLQDVVQASEMVKTNKMMKAKIFHVEWKLSETMRGHGATSPVSLNSGPIQIRSRHLTHDMSYSSCLSHSLPIQSSCISHLRLYIPPSPSSHSPPSLNQWKQWSQKVVKSINRALCRNGLERKWTPMVEEWSSGSWPERNWFFNLQNLFEE